MVGFHRRVELPVNVKDMARQRIINLFNSGLPVHLSISGGKDSIVLASLTYDLIREGKVDPKQLIVNFIDEEAMHEEVIRVAKDWRKKFMLAGARFDWWCIEVKHFNCFNMLENDETFICWDRYAKDRWVRPMPKFAKTSHPLLRPRTDTYQDFLERLTRDGVTLTGVRLAESFQRRMSFREKPKALKYQPIYDWKDGDIWLYIKEHGLDFPETYIDLYRTGEGRRGMRLSQFFSVDTAKSLVKLAEFDPELMKRVQRREPNANLVLLYWDSEMFRTSSRGRNRAGNAKNVEETKDYRAEVMKMMKDPEYTDKDISPSRYSVTVGVRRILLRYGPYLEEREWEQIYNMMIAGDPKSRTLRALGAGLAIKRGENAK